MKLDDVRLNLSGDFRHGGRAVERGKFQALILGGIVAGGHVDATDGFAMPDVVRNGRCGRVAIAKERCQPVGGEHFSGGQ